MLSNPELCLVLIQQWELNIQVAAYPLMWIYRSGRETERHTILGY